MLFRPRLRCGAGLGLILRLNRAYLRLNRRTLLRLVLWRSLALLRLILRGGIRALLRIVPQFRSLTHIGPTSRRGLRLQPPCGCRANFRLVG